MIITNKNDCLIIDCSNSLSCHHRKGQNVSSDRFDEAIFAKKSFLDKIIVRIQCQVPSAHSYQVFIVHVGDHCLTRQAKII